MRKIPLVLLLVLAAVGACRRQVQVASPPPAAGGAGGVTYTGTGGASAREALERFMAAAKTQDLDAMSVAWGTSAGPVRSTMSREEWEMREVVIMRCLRHDSYRVTGEVAAVGAERMMVVEMKFKDLTRSTNFYVVQGPSQRWYVRHFDREPIEAICQRRI